MNKTMLRIVAIAMIVSIVALSGCVGDKEPAEVEPTPEVTPAETPDEATPAETPDEATPAETVTPAEPKEADAGALFTPSIIKDLPSAEAPTGCDDIEQRVLRMYDQNGDGFIDDTWMQDASIDVEFLRITLKEYNQVKYAYEHNCPVEPRPAEPAEPAE